MTLKDQATLALTIWRENRSGRDRGMQSIVNVVMNRVKKLGTDAYTECLRLKQFSSMTFPGDKQLALGPNPLDLASWETYLIALTLVEQASLGNLPDLTGGATLYYNPQGIQTTKTIALPDGRTVPWPATWDAGKVQYRTEIASHLFFVET